MYLASNFTNNHHIRLKVTALNLKLKTLFNDIILFLKFLITNILGRIL